MQLAAATDIRANYQRVLAQIEQTASAAGRAAEQVRLVVVTKGHPLETVQQVIAAGAHWLGENYAEEGAAKKLAVGTLPHLEWHMIGHVQSRKAPLVGQHFDCLHSLDTLKLAQRLDRAVAQSERAPMGRRLPVLLECNVSGEETKFGWPAWDETTWDGLLVQIAPLLELPNLEVRGLMTMAPFLAEVEATRPYFQRLRRLQDALRQRFPESRWDELSMGMSADFQVAIQEGATLLRIGTAIVGSRPQAVVN